MTVSWNPAPGSLVTASNRLCPGTPESLRGVVVVSVPSVVDDVGVTGVVSGSGFSKTLTSMPLGNGRYEIVFQPGAQGVTATGAATFEARVVDQRNKTYTLSTDITLADCTLTFRWVSLPDGTIAGSNATCPNTPKRTSGLIRASLPSAVETTQAEITVPAVGATYPLTVRSLSGGYYAVDIDASLLPPVQSSSNTVRFKATDIADGHYEVTTTVKIVDCRGALTWVNPPPAQLSLTACDSIPSLPFDVVLSVQVPELVPQGSVTAEGRDFEVGAVSYSPVDFVPPNQFRFTVNRVPAGTVEGHTLVVRAYAPDHRETPFVATLITACPDAPVEQPANNAELSQSSDNPIPEATPETTPDSP